MLVFFYDNDNEEIFLFLPNIRKVYKFSQQIWTTCCVDSDKPNKNFIVSYTSSWRALNEQNYRGNWALYVWFLSIMQGPAFRLAGELVVIHFLFLHQTKLSKRIWMMSLNWIWQILQWITALFHMKFVIVWCHQMTSLGNRWLRFDRIVKWYEKVFKNNFRISKWCFTTHPRLNTYMYVFHGIDVILRNMLFSDKQKFFYVHA